MDKTCSCVISICVVFCINIVFPEDITECVPPSIPMNGSLEEMMSMYEDGDGITYKCDEGFVLIGYENRTCTNTTWTGQMPSCVFAGGHKPQIYPLHSEEYLEQDLSLVVDKKTGTCIETGRVKIFEFHIRTENIVKAFRVYLAKGTYRLTASVSTPVGGGQLPCTSLATLKTDGWASFQCKVNMTMTADQISIVLTISSFRINPMGFCEIEVYGNDGSENAETNPTDNNNVGSGDATINPTANVSNVGNTDGQTNEVHSNGDVTIIVTVVVILVAFGCFIGVFLYIYKKKRQNTVNVVKEPHVHYDSGETESKSTNVTTSAMYDNFAAEAEEEVA